MTAAASCWHSSYEIDPMSVYQTTASLDPRIERCPICGVPVAVRIYDSTLAPGDLGRATDGAEVDGQGGGG